MRTQLRAYLFNYFAFSKIKIIFLYNLPFSFSLQLTPYKHDQPHVHELIICFTYTHIKLNDSEGALLLPSIADMSLAISALLLHSLCLAINS